MVIKKFIRKIRGKKYPNRFLKFYHENRKRLLKERKSLYRQKRDQGICVRCSRKAVKGIIFCTYHRNKHKVYNKNARKSD